MDAESILMRHAAAAGWDEASQLALVCRYIDNQGDNACFDDFLARQVLDETTTTDELEQDHEDELDDYQGDVDLQDPELPDDFPVDPPATAPASPPVVEPYFSTTANTHPDSWFSHFEVQSVRTYGDPAHGETFTEPYTDLDTHDEANDTRPPAGPVFYTVYGRFHRGGHAALGDFATAEAAEQVVTYLVGRPTSPPSSKTPNTGVPSDAHIARLRELMRIPRLSFWFREDRKLIPLHPAVVEKDGEPVVFAADGTGQYYALWATELEQILWGPTLQTLTLPEPPHVHGIHPHR